eukprot:7498163-Ditylum_brightwellii.AAC.1
MSIAMLYRNFEVQGTQREKAHTHPLFPFIPDKEPMVEIDKVKITLKVSTGVTRDKNNATKNSIAMFKYDSLEE